MNTDHYLQLVMSRMANAIRTCRDHRTLTLIKKHAAALISLLHDAQGIDLCPNTVVTDLAEKTFLQSLAVDVSPSPPPGWQAYFDAYLGVDGGCPGGEAAIPSLVNIPTYSYGDEFSGIICPNPFLYLELHTNGDLSPCCYLPFSIGNIRQQSLEEIWHSPVARVLRQSIKDGSYRYCDKRKCAGMQKIGLGEYRNSTAYQIPYELFCSSELISRGLNFMVEDALEGRVPRIVSFDDDPTCNLACPSCRTSLYVASPQEAATTYSQDMAVLDAIPLGVEELWFSGAGDPLASSVYRRIFAEFDWNRYPTIRIRIDTNGMLLTEGSFSAVLSRVVDKIFLIAISVDAVTPESYEIIRKGGVFSRLLSNLEGLAKSEYRKHMQIVLRMIVQVSNFKEMGGFVELGKSLGVDTVAFSAISNWGTFLEDDFKQVAVHTPDSVEHHAFLQTLLDVRLRDPIVDMGNLTALFHNNLTKHLKEQIDVRDVVHSGTILPLGKRALAIAFYLPQFHPIPENDRWWGKGFTEWTNVGKAVPLFEGHYQPHVPADLGYYDLRVPEIRLEQAEMARRYGVDAFCYWHYWFAGHQLLERPFDEVVRTGQPDFPFCLGWANQTWSGIWHGAPDRVLIEQTYPGLEDYKAHFDTLLPAFRDPRYLRVHDRPLFVIYAPTNLPDACLFTSYWQQLAQEAGLGGIYFVAHNVRNPETYGCQACVDNAPFVSMNAPLVPVIPLSGNSVPKVSRYEDLVLYLKQYQLSGNEYPLVVPNWDNTPRSGSNGFVLQGSTPELFGEMLEDALRKVEQRKDPADRIVFIKAWNEWAEGNHLEPDLLHGHAYLQALYKALLHGASRHSS